MKRVFVGLSGGVDSSVTALLLKQQGYDVVGVYMKNWSQDLPGMHCSWLEDYQDAKRVAVQLGIDFKMYDFQKDYKHKVVNYMLDEFKAGRTPNPDIICNQEIKFKLFLNTALEDGADYVATGHYARLVRDLISHKGRRSGVDVRDQIFHMLMAKDANKDQTYFLYRISLEALGKTLWPLGELTKPQVREVARKNKLVTADKKDSMGICFVGKVSIKDFLMEYVQSQPGAIIEQNGKTIGQHGGAIFYTIGQRHGLELGGGLPYYVTGKNMKKNEVYVTTDLQDENLWNRVIRLTDMHWINKPKAESQKPQADLAVRIRHRAKLIPVKKLKLINNNSARAELGDDVRALTPGQSAVFYAGELVLGGGIVF